ncbi:AraC family transcriptional regulator [soil metagenome]
MQKIKSAVRKSAIPETNAFVIQRLDDAHFDLNWHFHQEYQLFVVLEGTGTRFIGDNIKPFKEGDMVFTGPDLPHLWRCDDIYFQKYSKLRSRGIVIYFQDKFLGKSLLHKDEMTSIRQLFQRARQGMEIYGKTNTAVSKMMVELEKLSGLDSIIKLLQILNELAVSTEYQSLSKSNFIPSYKESDNNRMNKVYEHILKNFKHNISLNEVAAIASMTPSSFSRYFKARANKSFSNFVSEIRTGHARKLLLEDHLNIAQVCYECGFKTLSNFNKQFKEITGTTPLKYRKEYLKVI